MRGHVRFTALVLGCLGLALSSGCGGGGGSGSPAAARSTNFRLLVSDEVNAIADFSSLTVRITSIGLQSTDGTWVRLSQESTGGVLVDLVPLTGTNATEVWSGAVPAGDYLKAFLSISEANGVLAADGQTVPVTVPSGKLKITKPFTVTDGATSAFVYDITVVPTADGYLLKPQITECGDDKEFEEVDQGDQESEGADRGLHLVLQGDPWSDPTVTLTVTTDDGVPVADATVSVDGTQMGITGPDGTLALDLTGYSDEIEIRAESEGIDGELELEAKDDDESDSTEWFEGTIVSVTDGATFNSPWTVDVAGVGTVTVNVTDLEGDVPGVGDTVVIEGTIADGVVQDAKVENEGAQGKDD